MAARKRLITIDDLFRLRVISSATISPDGQQVAFAQGRVDAKANKNYSNLYMVSSRGGRLQALTLGDDVDTAPRFSPDGRWVAFLSRRDKTSALWLLPLKGGEPRRLTSRDYHVASFDWSPNGRSLVYAARALSERERLLRDNKQDTLAKRPAFRYMTRLHFKDDGLGFWEGTYHHIYCIGVRGGRPQQLTQGSYEDETPAWSPDGRWIAYASSHLPDPDRDPDHRDVYVVSPQGGRARKLTTNHGFKGGLSWSPDSTRLAWIGHTGGAYQFFRRNLHVWQQSLSGGPARNITRHIDNNCMNLILADTAGANFTVDPPLWSADGTRLFFQVSEDGACRLYGASAAGGRAQVRIGGDLMAYGLTRTAACGPAAVILGDALNPSDIAILEPEAGDAPRRITRVNGVALGRLDLATPEPFSCRHGRTTTHGWVLSPPHKWSPRMRPGRKYPMILQIHGGPHGQYGHAFFHEMQWLAAQGYVVLYCNPTGSAGYGLQFQGGVHAAWGKPDYRDLMACVDKLIRRRHIDRSRLYVTGGSYGGFMTNMIVGRTDRFRAAVTQRSVVNMVSMAGTSDCGFDIAYEIGGTPWSHPKNFRELSPLTYVRRIRTPLLIMHSEQDLRCPVGQAEELYTTMKYLGKEVEYVMFEGESHGLSRGGRPQNRAERLRRILGWFQRYR